ncbi:MAG: hypothetical protein JXQ90_08340 [Cyclobacteriaceae bacterium]
METHRDSNTWIGIVLIIIGGTFLLDNLELIPNFIPWWVFGWEMIMVVVGGAMLATGKRGGVVFLAIGLFFLLPDILHIPHWHIRDFWPVVLIIVGITIITRRRHLHLNDASVSSVDVLDETSILGGGKRVIDSKSFRGGKISAVFGGSEIDLTNAELATGTNVLDIFCMFGGTTLILPKNWTVKNEVQAVLGGFTDSRIVANLESGDPDKVLIIKGFVMFGGGEIRA